MKKIFSFIILTSFVLVSIIGLAVSPKPATAQNIGSLQSIVTYGFSFKKDMKLGDTDPDVKELQKVLNADVDTMVATEEAGSPGFETTYFGTLTKNAVIKFQNKYKDIVLTLNSITVADGVVNRPTRTRLNLLVGVMNTYDSVGTVQSAATTYVTPTQVITPTPLSQSTICAFVNTLISTNVISANLANPARIAVGCPTVTTLSPSVDVKINGSDGPVTISSARDVTISWTSANVTSCTSADPKPLSGSDTIYVDASGSFGLSCTGPYGTVTDYVQVTLTIATATVPSVQVACLAYPTSVSLGVSTNWVGNVTGGTGSYAYSWSGTDSLSGSTQLVTKTYSTAGTKSAVLTVTSGTKIASSTCSAIVVATTTASTTIPLQVSCAPTPSSAGIGSPVSWVASPIGGNNIYTYSWTGTDSLTGTTKDVSKSYTIDGTKTATVSVTSGTSTATGNCIALIYPAENIASSTTDGGAAEVPLVEIPGESEHLSFEGVVTGVFQCYSDSGSIKDRFQMVNVSACGSPVTGSAAGSGGVPSGTTGTMLVMNSSSNGTSGTSAGGATGASSETHKFLWDSVDGKPLPVVGQHIVGQSNVKADAFGEKCPKVGINGGAIMKSSEFGGVDGGWLTANFDVDSGSTGCTVSNPTTSGCNPGILGLIGPLLFGPAFSSSGCSGSGGSSLLDPLGLFGNTGSGGSIKLW